MSVFLRLTIAGGGVAVGMGGWALGRVWAAEDGRSLMDMLELAAVTVPAVAQVLEVRADSGFVLLVDLVFVSEFLVVVGEGTLRGEGVTSWLKGQNPR